MKLIRISAIIALNLINVFSANAQVCLTATTIFGVSSNGTVRSIDYNNGSVGSTNLNTSSGSPSSSNSLGYNNSNGKFYYFRRIPGTGSPSEFVCFTPSTLGVGNTETLLASNPSTVAIVSGCVSSNGAGYYCIDANGVMYYYRIATNTWTTITDKFRLSNGTEVTSDFQNKSGDIVIDGNGRLWLIVSTSSSFQLYRIAASLPTSNVSSLTVTQVMGNTSTPSGNAFAGICFNGTGQIIMVTSNGQLYRLENNLTVTYLSTLTISSYANDLTSCLFPIAILPIIWKSYTVSVANNVANLSWVIDAQSNEKEFYVETSTDGTHWTELGKVAAKAKTGNDLTYTFTTGSIVNGNNYFRIRQVDMDNNIGYSEIKVVNVSKAAKINLWPNPAQEFINLQHTKQITTATKAQIFDQAGRLVKEATILAGTTQVNISSLISGSYYIRVQFADGEVFKQLFVKQ